MKTLYTTHATTIAGREGFTETDDKKISMKLDAPGSNKPGTNPEQLFACGYSACFGSAINAIAKKEGAAPSEIKVEAAVALNQDDAGGYYLAVELNASLAGIDNAAAQKLVRAAHQICPYSKATRGNIQVNLKANGQPLPKAA